MYFSEEELSRVFGEIWRLLKPGGFLLTKKNLSSEKLLKKQGLPIRYVDDYLLQKQVF
jgi:hypothetical protein